MAYVTLTTSYVDGSVYAASAPNETNTVVNALSNGTNQVLVSAKGDLLSGSATANALVKTSVGVANRVLTTDSTASGGIAWGQITSAMITDGTITGTDIASGTVTSANIVDATIVNGDISASAGIVDTKLATIATAGKVSNSATTATSANLVSTIVARDASGEFNATFASFAGRNIGGLDYAPAVTCGAAPTTTSTGVLRVGNYTSGTTCITTNSITAGTAYHMAFHLNGTVVGGISSSGATTTFSTTSDYRLKENIVPLANALAQIDLLKPKQYNFITEPNKTLQGFIAHELAEIVPYAVTGEKDAVDEEGNIKPQQVDYSKLTGLLVGAVQELSARVKELENN